MAMHTIAATGNPGSPVFVGCVTGICEIIHNDLFSDLKHIAETLVNGLACAIIHTILVANSKFV